jgi:hypothetical protein
MIKIAHRGNYKGRDALNENTIPYIYEAIQMGFNVEIDAWLIDDVWYLGHDFPNHMIDLEFMERPEIWVHAKNLIGYVSLFNNRKVHTFWHDKDDFVFTSKNIKWCRSDIITYDGVSCMPSDLVLEHYKESGIMPLGICSDDFTHLFVK